MAIDLGNEEDVSSMENKLTYDFTDNLIGPHQVALDITNKCNLRCLHCYNFSGENNVVDSELSDDEILEFIKSLQPIKPYNVCFCGGEPLLRKDLLIRCARVLSDNGSIVSIVSNGILASDSSIDELCEAGVKNIQYSLDGINGHDKLRNMQGVFEKAVKAITYTAQKDVMLSVAFCPTAFNINEFSAVYSLIEEISLKYRDENRHIKLRVQPLMPIGRASDNIKSIMPSEQQYRELIRQINSKTNGTLTIDWGDPIDHLIRFTTRKLPVNFCTIRANGDLIVSPYLPLIIGNIKVHSLQEYWDCGLNRIWERQIVRHLANHIKSIPDMYTISDILPRNYKEEEIKLDLFDHDLDDLSLLKQYM